MTIISSLTVIPLYRDNCVYCFFVKTSLDGTRWTVHIDSVDQSVFLPAGDKPGIEQLMQYMTRCSFSLSRLVKVTKTGQIIAPA